MSSSDAALLFPGQGAQVAGMGASLCRDFPVAEKTFKDAEDLTGYDLRKIAFEGPKDVLDKTLYSQLCLLVHSTAVLRVWQEKYDFGTVKYFAGLSLGEYSAHVAAGVLQFADAVMLVKQRASLMQNACDTYEGGMVSVIGLDRQSISDMLQEVQSGKMTIANLNCPGQIVVSGDRSAQEEVAKKAKEKGAKLAVILSVAGAFHSWHMDEASEQFRETLMTVSIRKENLPRVLSNYSGEFYQVHDDWVDIMAKQINHPVRFEENLTNLIRKGADQFMEMGSGKTIAGMLKRVDKSKVCRSFGESADFC